MAPCIASARAAACIAVGLTLSAGAYAIMDGGGDPAAVTSEDGKWVDKAGNPTFKIGADGSVDIVAHPGLERRVGGADHVPR